MHKIGMEPDFPFEFLTMAVMIFEVISPAYFSRPINDGGRDYSRLFDGSQLPSHSRNDSRGNLPALSPHEMCFVKLCISKDV